MVRGFADRNLLCDWWLHPDDSVVALVATCPMVGLWNDRLDCPGTWSGQVPLYSSRFYASWSRISRGRHSGYAGRCRCGLAITWRVNEKNNEHNLIHSLKRFRWLGFLLQVCRVVVNQILLTG